MGTLELTRSSKGYEDATRAYKVYIDGKEVDSIKKGEIKKINLNDGIHTLQLKIDWCTSQLVNFVIENDNVVYAECQPCMKKGIFGNIKAITKNKNNYIDLYLK